jgi:hypothetical protein
LPKETRREEEGVWAQTRDSSSSRRRARIIRSLNTSTHNASMAVDTPSPTSGDREPTPDLSRSYVNTLSSVPERVFAHPVLVSSCPLPSSRHKSDAVVSPTLSRHSSHRSSHRDDDRERSEGGHRSSRRHRDSRDDDEEDEARRRRKRREREEAGEDDEDPEERRRRRSERREREDRSSGRRPDRDDDDRRGGERKRSRSRESGHRSRGGSESGRRGGKTLEERERERADRDREMKNEAREREREKEDCQFAALCTVPRRRLPACSIVISAFM